MGIKRKRKQAIFALLQCAEITCATSSGRATSPTPPTTPTTCIFMALQYYGQRQTLFVRRDAVVKIDKKKWRFSVFVEGEEKENVPLHKSRRNYPKMNFIGRDINVYLTAEEFDNFRLYMSEEEMRRILDTLEEMGVETDYIETAPRSPIPAVLRSPVWLEKLKGKKDETYQLEFEKFREEQRQKKEKAKKLAAIETVRANKASTSSPISVLGRSSTPGNTLRPDEQESVMVPINFTSLLKDEAVAKAGLRALLASHNDSKVRGWIAEIVEEDSGNGPATTTPTPRNSSPPPTSSTRPLPLSARSTAFNEGTDRPRFDDRDETDDTLQLPTRPVRNVRKIQDDDLTKEMLEFVLERMTVDSKKTPKALPFWDEFVRRKTAEIEAEGGTKFPKSAGYKSRFIEKAWTKEGLKLLTSTQKMLLVALMNSEPPAKTKRSHRRRRLPDVGDDDDDDDDDDVAEKRRRVE